MLRLSASRPCPGAVSEEGWSGRGGSWPRAAPSRGPAPSYPGQPQTFPSSPRGHEAWCERPQRRLSSRGEKEPTKLNGIKSGKTDDGSRGFRWGPLEREAARAPFLGVLLAREWPRPDLSFPRRGKMPSKAKAPPSTGMLQLWSRAFGPWLRCWFLPKWPRAPDIRVQDMKLCP